MDPAPLRERELSVAYLTESSGAFCTEGEPQRQECCQLQVTETQPPAEFLEQMGDGDGGPETMFPLMVLWVDGAQRG